MTAFYKMKSHLGERSPNYASDVAYIQLLVKLGGGLIRPGGMSQVIDGRFDEFLLQSAAELFGSGPGKVSFGHSFSGSGRLTRRVGVKLLKFLPAELKAQRLFVGGVRASSLMLLPANTTSEKTPLRVSANEVALPETQKHHLLVFLSMLSRHLHVVPRMEKVHVDGASFHVHVTVTGGKRIDNRTGTIVQPGEFSWRKKGASGLLDHLQAVIEQEKLDRFIKSYWSLKFDDGLKLVTKQQFPLLRITRNDKRNILRSLPYPGKRPRIKGDAIQTCYAAYETARNSGKLTPAQRQEFYSCFGSDADIILRNEKARKAACSTWLARYTKLVAKQQKLGNELKALKDAIDTSELARAAFEASGHYVLIAEIAFAIVGLSAGKVGKTVGKSLDARSPDIRARNAKRGAQVASVSSTGAGIAIFPIEDLADGFAVTLSVAAGVAALFAVTAPAAAALAAAAALVGAADALWNYFQKDREFDEANRRAIQKQINEAPALLAKIAENTQSIGNLLLAMKNEGCDRSIADFLEQGNHSIRREDIATDWRSRRFFDRSDIQP